MRMCWRKLNVNFQKLEAELSITKNTNSLLQKRVVDLERECWANAQYSRRECLELVRIPASGSHDSLKDKVLNVFDKMGCHIQKENVEACHRISKHNDRTIMKLTRRKDCQQVLPVKRDLRNLSVEDVGFPGDTRIQTNLLIKACAHKTKSNPLANQKVRSITKSVVSF